ncbi:MAG: VC0807 family protein, partial [Actinomycetes bacterium]
GVMGLAAAASLLLERPLIARIRRDFSGPKAEFDRTWAGHRDFRVLHRRMTAVWALALFAEAIVGTVVVYGLPLTLAVIVTTTLSPAVILALIAWTHVRAQRWEHRTRAR